MLYRVDSEAKLETPKLSAKCWQSIMGRLIPGGSTQRVANSQFT